MGILLITYIEPGFVSSNICLVFLFFKFTFLQDTSVVYDTHIEARRKCMEIQTLECKNKHVFSLFDFMMRPLIAQWADDLCFNEEKKRNKKIRQQYPGEMFIFLFLPLRFCLVIPVLYVLPAMVRVSSLPPGFINQNWQTSSELGSPRSWMASD